jgi:mono/diheme cytochrome c family protein
MHSTRHLRPFIALVTLLSTILPTGLIHAQSDGNNPAIPTLNELKISGAQRSNYVTQSLPPRTTKAPKSNLSEFRRSIQPILKGSCIDCHGPETQEGNIRLDTLDPDLQRGSDVKWWIEVLGVINNGEMPPADADPLTAPDRSQLVQWLSTELQIASQVRRAEQGHSSFRRLTRYEYNYALQDLLGIPYNLAKDLPPEANTDDGFQNSSEMLHMSITQLETYREIASTAITRAVALEPQPNMLQWNIPMQATAARHWSDQDQKIAELNKQLELDGDKQKHQKELDKLMEQFRQPHNNTYYRDLQSGRTVRSSWQYYGAKYAHAPTTTPTGIPAKPSHVAIIPRGQFLIIELGNQIPPEGTLRVRVRAAQSSDNSPTPPSLRLEFGWTASNDSRALIRLSEHDLQITAGTEAPQFYQWEIPLGNIYPRNSVRTTAKMGATPNPSEYIRLSNSSISQGAIQIDHVEITGPVHSQWPPESHNRIFIDSPNRSDEPRYAKEVLENFMPQAWRREVNSAEVQQKLALFNKMRPEFDNSEQAMVEVLATVLASPNFLYVARATTLAHKRQNTTEQLTDYELATRLSLFLWCSTPDRELFDLAHLHQLHQPNIFAQQVQRMLADPKSQRLAKQFVQQWLDLQLLDFLQVDPKSHPRFNPELKLAMQHEPIAFFAEMLTNNLSILDFIHADYAMLNEALGQHYGISDVFGNEMRRVSLNGNHRRGGLLTQAGLLAMNSDGVDSHPLKRGIWLLESLLHDPPPPPPPAVPEIDLADPKIAEMTLKQRIENHRDHAACRSCHAKIDPWGIAFENYDAIGQWRTSIEDEPVDASSFLFNNYEIIGMDGLKRYLLTERQDQFTRALTYKLVTFALGRPLTFADRSSIDQITADVRKQGDGLATLITLICKSDLFYSK